MILRPRVASKMHGKVKRQDVAAFFSQLSTLFRAGTPLMEALAISADQTESEKLAAVCRELAKKIGAGSALHEALASYPQHFKVEWIEVVRSGEESGQLGPILETLVEQMDAAAQMRSQLIGALTYPVIILIVASLCVAVMLVKVVPTFAKMFDDFGKKLPEITEYVLQVSYWFQAHWLQFLGGLAGGVLALRYALRTPGGKAAWDKIQISLPLLGDVTVQRSMQKFANNLSLLLKAGLPLLDAIVSLKGIFRTNTIYAAALGQVERQVASGSPVAAALEETGVFTSFAFKMTRIGEESGNLPEVLDQVDLLYRRKVLATLGRITKAIETFAILFMGVAVAVILCAIYLPLFSMASGV